MNKVFIVILIIVAIFVLIFGAAIVITLLADAGLPEPALAAVPFAEMEATVVSLHLDDLHADCNAPIVCAHDKATLAIDSIDRTNDPNNSINFSVGEQVEFEFSCTARPAKFVMDVPPTCGSGVLRNGSCYLNPNCEGKDCVVSNPNYAAPLPELVDGVVVFHFPQTAGGVIEKSLPGLNVGDKIKIRVDQAMQWISENNIIGSYTVIQPAP